MEIQGKYNKAKIFTDNVDGETIGQIIQLCNQKAFEGEQIRIMPDCLTEDTEVLTKQGFKLIKDLEDSDLVANYKDNKIFFSKVKNKIVRDLKPNEKIYEYSSKNLGIKIKVSENHRMALKENMNEIAKNIEVLKLKDMNLSGNYFGKYSKFNNYKTNYLLLLLRTVGDGSYAFSNKNTVRIRFGFKKERKILRIKELLESLEIDYKLYNEKKETSIYINTKDSKEIYKILGKNKNYPIELIFVDKDKRIKMIDELIKIDGDYLNFVKFNTYRLNSKRKKDIDFFQMLMCLTERYSIFKEKISNGFGRKKIERREIKYNGKLVCLECSSSYFVARQNGMVFITGNCHAGKGCTIGTTMTITDKIVPSLVGGDINCGVLGFVIPKDIEIDLQQLDETIRKHIPHGFSIRNNTEMGKRLLWDAYDIYLETIFADINLDRAYKSVGTLGGGNHFIELDQFQNGDKMLVVHSGSRHLGLEVANYYQKKAIEHCTDKYDNLKKQEVEKLKNSNIRPEDREQEIKKINTMYRKPQDELCYLEGELMGDYIHDMNIVQKYAQANRMVMLHEILSNLLGFEEFQDLIKRNDSYFIESVHNYLDIRYKILRKGSISAQKDEKLIIPINMRDGVIIGRGKGNSDWNYSAPHGAGRILSRRAAKEQISIEEFKSSMKDVYSTSVCNSTLDEAPQAYKPIEEIIDNIGDSVEILEIVKPIYNFKSN